MTSTSKVAVIITAAGLGERLNAGKPKALAQVMGLTLLEISFQKMSPIANQILVTYPEGYIEDFQKLLGESVELVPGGSNRQLSIYNALQFLAPDIEYVLIHDCARAFASTELAYKVIEKLEFGAQAVVPTLNVTDTIKILNEDNYIKKTPKRDKLVIAQTPQGFSKKVILNSHQKAIKKKILGTDDAMLAELAGYKVEIVVGEENAFKITYPADIKRAQNISQQDHIGVNYKVGIGSDTHAFSKDPDRKLWLGGLYWENETGLDGHSDADVALHAICDAIFSACDLGDLGSNFGVDQPQYIGASGESLLQECHSRAKNSGFKVVNVSVQIICNKPKISNRRGEIAARISSILNQIPVTVTATTTDGLGLTGNGGGISAIAVANVSYEGL